MLHPLHTHSRHDLSQSDLHLGIYYVGCRIEAAVSHLVQQPDDKWPLYWEDILDREFKTLHALQQIHATRSTSQVPPPAIQGIYHVSRGKLREVLREFDMNLCRLAADIPQLLPNWDESRANDFDGKWWVAAVDPDAVDKSADTRIVALVSGRKYFQNLWPRDTSPLDAKYLMEIDSREQHILGLLQSGMEELERLDEEINHCWARYAGICQMVGHTISTSDSDLRKLV